MRLTATFSLLLSLLLIPVGASAQRILALDDTTAADEIGDAADRLGLDAVVVDSWTEFEAQFDDSGPWDLLVLDVAVANLPTSGFPVFSEHLEAERPIVFGYSNLDGSPTLRGILGLTLVRNLGYEPLYSSPGPLGDLFNLVESLPSPLRGADNFPDDGDSCSPDSTGTVLARVGSETGDPGIVMTLGDLVLYNPIVLDDFRSTDADGDGVRDSVELLTNEIALALDAVEPDLLVVGEGSGDAFQRYGIETETEIVRVPSMAEVPVLLADDPFGAVIIESTSLASVDPAEWATVLDAARAEEVPLLLFSPALTESPDLSNLFGVTTEAPADAPRWVGPGTGGVERVIFRQPSPADPLAPTSDAAGPGSSPITDTGSALPLARFDDAFGPVAIACDPEGLFAIGGFLLSDLGDEDTDADGLSDSTELLRNLLDFSRSAAPLALLLSNAAPDADSLDDALAESGFYSIVESDAGAFSSGIDAGFVEFVGVEDVDGALAALSEPSSSDAARAWIDTGAPFLFVSPALATLPLWETTLGVQALPALSAPEDVSRNPYHLGRVFQLPTPTPPTLDARVVAGVATYGTPLSLSDPGSIVAAFSESGPATVVTHAGMAMVNAFHAGALTDSDADADQMPDLVQFYIGQIHALQDPQRALVFDDGNGSGDSIFAEAALRSGLAPDVTSDPGLFAGPAPAGSYQVLAIDATATSALVDPAAADFIDSWIGDDNAVVVAFADFDGSPEVASLFEVEGTDATTIRSVVPSAGDPLDLFAFPGVVPFPLMPGVAAGSDPGDDIRVTAGGTIGARFARSNGPGATALTRQGLAAVNSFVPRELDTHDYDEDGVHDRVQYFQNQIVRVARAPVASAGGPYATPEGLTVRLDAGASFDPFEEALTYAWDLDEDGAFDDASGVIASLSGVGLDGPATRTISVQVVNASGLRDIDEATVTVSNTPPVVSAGPDRTVQQGAELSASVSVSDIATDTVVVSWDLGDGATASGTSVTHRYTTVGLYTIAVTAVDDDGAMGADTVQITYANVAPSIEIGSYPTVPEGTLVNFTSSTSDPGGDAVTVSWTFGDGDTAVGPSPAHAFGDNGAWNVTATATDSNGGARTDSANVLVTNVAPSFASTPSTEGEELVEYVYDAIVVEPGYRDVLTYRLLSAPAGMTLDAAGHIRWTPGAEGYGNADVALRVEDGDGGSAEQSWTISVSFADGDDGGAPDSCEDRFGFDPLDAADDASDSDGDGIPLWQECVDGLDPTLFSGPSSPFPVSPVDGIGWDEEDVVLIVQNATDPDDDVLTYDFEIFAEGSGDTLIANAEDIPEGDAEDGITQATLVGDFIEDAVYRWRARASDGRTDGPWGVDETFVFNNDNAAPDRPEIVSPIRIAVDNPPVLHIRNASDFEGEPLTYDFELYQGDAPVEESLVFARSRWPEGADGETYCEVDLPLDDGQSYVWRVRAHDGHRFGPFAIGQFVLDSANSPPTAPTVVRPVDGATVLARGSVGLEWTNATDPDGDRVTYNVQIDDAEDFASPLASVSNLPGQPQETTVSVVEAPLEAGTPYWWRVAATDGFNTTEWDVGTFVTIEANTPPAAPVPIEPLAGARIRLEPGGISLLVGNAFDPDEQSLLYDFQVARDVAMSDVISSFPDVPEGEGSLTEVAFIPPGIGEYYWRARARDPLSPGSWTEVNGFTILPASTADVGVDVGDAGPDTSPDTGSTASGALGGGGGCSMTTSPSGAPPRLALPALIVAAFSVLRRSRRG